MARSRFPVCLEHVLAHEGGYVDHPSDPGGATNMGITHRTLARWRQVSPWWELEKSEVRGLGLAEASAIYRANYWDRSRAGDMPAGLDLALFDFAVNSGPDRAVRTLQTLLGVVADGHVGPITLGALERRVAVAGVSGLVDALCERRLGFLAGLSTFSVFGRGWQNRVRAVRAAALAMVQAVPAPLPKSEPNQWSTPMDLLSGYRTYLVAAAMIVAGLAQLLGVELPALDGHSAGGLIMEAAAIIFLRRGIKTEIGRA